MNNLTSAIKGKITAGNNKYVNRQEKRATVLMGNKADNRCAISLVNRDGIVQVFYNVPVLYTAVDTTNVSWFPANGEEVLVVENNKDYVITGPSLERPNISTEFDIYSYETDTASGNMQ